jgi:hypothetical protein
VQDEGGVLVVPPLAQAEGEGAEVTSEYVKNALSEALQ